MQNPDSGSDASSEARRGLLYGLTAYFLWGLFPIYLKALGGVPPGEVLAHRIIWSLLLVSVVVALTGRWRAVRDACRNRRVLGVLFATSVLIAVNWLVYIHAVLSGRLLAGSLGYYLTPLVSIGLGVLVLKEPLTRMQKRALGLALAGIVVLAVGAGSALWISVTLALSFSAYGLLRKMAPVDPLTGLAIETALLVPIAGGYLIWRAGHGLASFGQSHTVDLLLLASGAVTAVPLLLFSAAAKRLRYSTVGILQFIAPSMQFALATFAYGEALTLPHIICFVSIWAAVAIYVAEGFRGAASADRTPAPPEPDARAVR